MRAIALVPLLIALTPRGPHGPIGDTVWLLPGMAFGRFRGTFRLSTRQCFGVTKFSPRGVVDLHAEKF